MIKSGIDLVYLPRFKKSLKNGGENFLRRVFTENELNHLRGVTAFFHLGGVFAAKEAVIKALNLPSDSWLDVRIKYKKNGAPVVEIINHKSKIINHSLSIAHDGSYIIAQFVAILDE